MIQAAGLLMYRKRDDIVEVFLTHPGGPFWAKKDEWSIPKGEADEGEELLAAMRREFIEETSIDPPLDDIFELGSAPVDANKVNYIWAAEGNIDIAAFRCDSVVTMPWPPRSDKLVTFPENDRAKWFELSVAQQKIFKSQVVFIRRLADHLGIELPEYVERANATLF